jgi:hypothetical protein
MSRCRPNSSARVRRNNFVQVPYPHDVLHRSGRSSAALVRRPMSRRRRAASLATATKWRSAALRDLRRLRRRSAPDRRRKARAGAGRSEDNCGNLGTRRVGMTYVCRSFRGCGAHAAMSGTPTRRRAKERVSDKNRDVEVISVERDRIMNDGMLSR